jgi:hypothetical protein
VHPVIYDFFISRYGETFDVDDDNMIALILPHILTLRPVDYKITKYPGYKYLDIVLHDFRFGAGGSHGTVYIEHKNHLPDNYQYHLSKYLDGVFKGIFHNFMLAHVMANHTTTQKEGIQNFCMVYRVAENRVNSEMLKKSWDRSDLKKKWKELVVKKS